MAEKLDETKVIKVLKKMNNCMIYGVECVLNQKEINTLIMYMFYLENLVKQSDGR